MNTITSVIGAVAIILVSLSLSCTANADRNAASNANVPEISSGDPALDAARKLWRTSGIRSYDMTIALDTSSYLEPARAVDVEVRDGTVISMVASDPNDKRGRFGFYQGYGTMEVAFEHVQKLRNDERLQPPATVSVRYNSEFGYVEEIKYSIPASHGTFTFSVRSFRVK